MGLTPAMGTVPQIAFVPKHTAEAAWVWQKAMPSPTGTSVEISLGI